MSPALRDLESAILERELVHDNHPDNDDVHDQRGGRFQGRQQSKALEEKIHPPDRRRRCVDDGIRCAPLRTPKIDITDLDRVAMTKLDHLYRSPRWGRIRKAQLTEHPLCKFCLEQGRLTVATIADHVEPHRGDINQFWVGKLQSLCLQCHVSTKHFIELNGYRPDIGLDGWPLDPRHPVYARQKRK